MIITLTEDSVHGLAGSTIDVPERMAVNLIDVNLALMGNQRHKALEIIHKRQEKEIAMQKVPEKR